MPRLTFALRLTTHLTAASALILALGGAAQAVTFDWVTVGGPSNACDVQPQGCFGSVADGYLISKFQTTNAQYAEFLNAKAVSDPLGLYTAGMATTDGGITRSGSSGSYSYSAQAGSESKPVNLVSFYDALRFTNWLHNGQGSGDTETGAYTLLGGTMFPSNGTTVTRNASATIFLPSEDEWYKAAYYDAVSMSYNPYPFADGFNGVVCEGPPGSTSHSANCSGGHGKTDVGAYTTSPSAYGTFDQGGNVYEWSETISGQGRIGRGAADMEASIRGAIWENPDYINVGFRIAMIPEPGTGLLVMTGLLGLAAWRRRPLR